MRLLFSFKHDWNFKEIIQNKKVVFIFYLLSFLPFMVFIFFIKEKKIKYEEYEYQIRQMQLRIEQTLDVQKERNLFFKKYGEADRYYLDNVLGVTTFLKPEISVLELIYGHPAFKSCDRVKNRLNFLTQGKNRLIYVEEDRQKKNYVEEVHWKQKQPIEINTEDIKHLFTLIEGIKIGENQPPLMSPQLIVKKMSLHKKILAEREIFLLDMHLIKREMVK